MDINFEKGVITLYDKNIKLEPLIKRLSLLSGEQVYHFLSNRGIQIPRAFNCYALISVLNQKIKFLHSKSLSKDYFQRLQYYKYFTEQQLFNLFRKICNDEQSFYLYRFNFFKLLLVNFVSMNLNDGEVTYLKNLKKGRIESFEEYFNYISSCSLEQEGSFDGVAIDELRTMLPLSASNQDIFDLAGKYGIDLPTRLKKKQFLDFIVYYMKKNNDYNDAIGEELEAMTVAQLTTYARRTGIPMQAAMSKNDLITYLFYYLDQCEIDYTSIKRVELLPEFEPLSFTIDFSLINNFQSEEPLKVIHYEGEETNEEEFNEMINEDIEDEEAEEEKPEVKAQAAAAVAATAVASKEEALDEIAREEEIVYEAPVENDSLNEEVVLEEEPVAEEPVVEEPVEEPTVEPVAEPVADEVINDESPAGEEESLAALDDEDDFEVQYVSDDYVASNENIDLDEEPIDEPVAEEVATPEVEADEFSDEEIQAIIDEHTKENKEEAKDNNSDKPIDDLNLEVTKNDSYGNQKLLKLAKGKGKAWAISISIVIVLALLGAVVYLLFLKK